MSWYLSFMNITTFACTEQLPLNVQIFSDLQLLSPQGNTKCLSKMGRERIQLVTLEISQDIPVNTLIYIENGNSFFMTTSSQMYSIQNKSSSSVEISIMLPTLWGTGLDLQVCALHHKHKQVHCWVNFLCILL